MTPTQNDRVAKMLRAAGRRGLTQLDLDGPTPDGGKPIRRLASRINDLRARGYEIDSTGRRNRMAVYRLISEPVPVSEAEPAAAPQEGAQLFDVARRARPASPYDDVWGES